jgi:hypothetical protein
MDRTRLIAGIALGLIISVGAQADQKKINQSKLPPAVQKAAEEQTAGATVTGYTREKVDGAMVYTMDLVADGLTRAIVMDPDGTVVSVEQEMAWSDLPADVQKDFANVAGKGTFEAASSISKDGRIVAYEAVRVTKGERAHVRVKPTTPVLEAVPAPGSSK